MNLSLATSQLIALDPLLKALRGFSERFSAYPTTSSMKLRYLLAALATVAVAPFAFGWLLYLVTYAIGGQLFVLVWLLPVLYCLFKSIPGVSS